MTDEVIRWHLSGADAEGKPFIAGIYPLLADDSCWFVAIDFDKSGWREDASACLETCRQLDLPRPRALALRKRRPPVVVL